MNVCKASSKIRSASETTKTAHNHIQLVVCPGLSSITPFHFCVWNIVKKILFLCWGIKQSAAQTSPLSWKCQSLISSFHIITIKLIEIPRELKKKKKNYYYYSLGKTTVTTKETKSLMNGWLLRALVLLSLFSTQTTKLQMSISNVCLLELCSTTKQMKM